MRLEDALVGFVASARQAAQTPPPYEQALRGPAQAALIAAARTGGAVSVTVASSPQGGRLLISGKGTVAARQAARQLMPAARAELARRWRDLVAGQIR